MADGAYDGEPTYQTVAERGPAATVIIPPRSTAVPGSTAEPTQRDGHIQSLADRGRLGWQRETNYGKRSKVETAMSRYKRILGDHLHARKLTGQQAEATIGVTVLNRMIDAGRPDSARIA
jgi:transposase